MNDISKKHVVECELLAPAGNPEMLHAAIDGGADAAYLGLQSFNARRNAKNFDFDSFKAACDYAHLRGAKLYVAMNTIVFEDELESAIDSAAKAYEIGADAFIIQDLGLANEIRKRIKGARLHASTQMSIHSTAGLQMASDLGFSRVTLAREMSLGEIENMCTAASSLDLEIETFAHGALCISYSGQCLMSSMIGCRSANRGLCAQPCRLEYELIDTRDPDRTVKAAGDHLLSPKDLCSIDDLDELVRMGVSSLKIEGRMKSPEYAHAVVAVYREQLDRVIDAQRNGSVGPTPNPDAREKLGSVFSRGFSSSYLDGQRGNSMMSYQRPNNRGQFIGRVKKVDDKTVEVSIEQPLKAGDICEIWTRRGNIIVNVENDTKNASRSFIFELDDAKTRNRPTQKNTFRPSKGDRVFRIRSADAQIDVSEMDPRIPIAGKIKVRIGLPLEASFEFVDDSDTVSRRLHERLNREVSGHAIGDVVEPARTKSITVEDVYQHIDRLGQTPFRLVDLEIELDDGVGMGFSQLHHLRSEALDNLKSSILAALGYEARAIARTRQTESRPKDKKKISINNIAASDISICAYVSNPECARVAKRNGADFIYVSALNYRRGMSQKEGMASDDTSQAGYPKHCIQVMGAISHDPVGQSREALLNIGSWDKIHEGSQVMVESIDGIGRALNSSCEFEIGPDLPIVNDAAFDVVVACGTKKVWLSSELSLSQIEELSTAINAEAKDAHLGIVISGAQELMKCEHCVLMSVGDCDENCPTCPRRKVPFALRDRMGYEFPVSTDHLGRTHIYNSLNTDNMNSVPRLLEAGVGCFMINAQLMNPEQVAQEVSRLRSAVALALESNSEIEKRKGTTTAHFYRPVA